MLVLPSGKYLQYFVIPQLHARGRWAGKSRDGATVGQIPLVLRAPSATRARQVGRQEPVMVLRVDNCKPDLSGKYL